MDSSRSPALDLKLWFSTEISQVSVSLQAELLLSACLLPQPTPCTVAPPPSHLARQQLSLLCPSPQPHWLLLTSVPSSLASSSFLERAPCLWLLPGVFMLASLHKLLADVCLLLKPHLQPERGEDFLIFFKDL